MGANLLFGMLHHLGFNVEVTVELFHTVLEGFELFGGYHNVLCQLSLQEKCVPLQRQRLGLNLLSLNELNELF